MICLQRFQRSIHLDLGYEQYNAGESVDPQYIEVTTISAADIAAFHIRGYWYFDKRQGRVKISLVSDCSGRARC